MKIVLTGSLGHISKPLAQTLIAKGHAVTVISSQAGRQVEIKSLGAAAAIGNIDDVEFLTRTFAEADLVYTMFPPNFAEPDFTAYYVRIANKYAQAIQAAGVPRVIHLSSFGAHVSEGVGIIGGAYQAEQILNAVPGISLTILRPTSFFYNFRNYIGMIRQAGAIYVNYGDEPIPLVAPADIAAAIVEEVEAPAERHKIRYLASDERTGAEVAQVLGAAIGKPDLQWILVPDSEVQKALEGNGLPAKLASELTEMYGALRPGGAMAEEYWKVRPALGATKLEDYAPEFAADYNGGEIAQH